MGRNKGFLIVFYSQSSKDMLGHSIVTHTKLYHDACTYTLTRMPSSSPSCPKCQTHPGRAADKNCRLKSTSHKMHYLAVKPGLAKLMKHFNSQINRSKVNFVKVC